MAERKNYRLRAGRIVFRVRYLYLAVLFGVQGCTAQRPVEPLTPPRLTVEAEGLAPVTDHGKLLARKQALQDAVRQASWQAGVTTQGVTSMRQDGILFDAFTMRTGSWVNFANVLREWEEEGLYHVRAQVTLSASDYCLPQYRKRIVATGFPLVKQGQLGGMESQDIPNGIPREIMNLMVQSGEFIGDDQTHTAVYRVADRAPSVTDFQPYTQSHILSVASQQGAQFVLSGVIRDLQIDPADNVAGAGLIAMAKNLARGVWGKRTIGVDIYVHDGFSGALLTQYRYTDAVIGDVWIPASYSVGSEGFRDHSVGARLSDIIDKASLDIRKALSCYPFTTRIIKIEGDKVYIDAGAQERLNIGDQLIVYGNVGGELHIHGGREFIGHDKQPVGVLTIRELQPRYAVGNMEVPPSQSGVGIGDWVRSW
ncbi:MAG: hypothetical protein Kow0065_19510 [Methylomicrobium sp.]